MNNLAITLRRLGRLDEARVAIREAIEQDRTFGDVAESWKSQAVLSDIERDAGNTVAAAGARAEAVRLYRDFRDRGGSPHDETGRLIEEVSQAVQSGADPAALAEQIPPASQFPDALLPTRTALIAVLERRPADLDDPRIAYDDAAEVARLRDAMAGRR